jgi:hypothetical protein
MKVGDLVSLGRHIDLGYAIITHIDADWARVLWSGGFEWIDLQSLKVVE